MRPGGLPGSGSEEVWSLSFPHKQHFIGENSGRGHSQQQQELEKTIRGSKQPLPRAVLEKHTFCAGFI